MYFFKSIDGFILNIFIECTLNVCLNFIDIKVLEYIPWPGRAKAHGWTW